MGNLGKMTIFIGREPGQSRLLLAVSVNGKVSQAALGQPGSVPKGVSRLIMAQNTAHCKINIDDNGAMTLTQVNPGNVSYVDGIVVSSKKISVQSSIALGSCRHPLNVSMILGAAQKIVGNQLPPNPAGQVPVSISHLKDIWDDYEKTIENIQRKNQEKSKRRMLPLIIGSASGIAAPILANVLSIGTLWLTIPIAVIMFCIWIKIYNEKDTSIEDKKAATDRLMDKYLCPSMSCRHFMGYQPYRLLLQNKKCPYCGTLFTEN